MSSRNMQQTYMRTSIQSAISVKMQCNFTAITLLHGRSPMSFLDLQNNFFEEHSKGTGYRFM